MENVDFNKEISVEEARELYKANGNKLVSSSTDAFVTLRDINKIYPNNVQAVFDFNLDINKHEFVALVGPSGCGKSTTLRMIAGLEEISSGHLYIDGVLANHLSSKDRDIAMVFQSYALYPQMSVYDNISFGLTIRKELLPVYDKDGNAVLDENGEAVKKIRHYTKKEIEERVFMAADILDLGPYLDRKPKELSGGQMQRVALGRAIVRNAKLFLMDEPLSNLDAKLRVQMRSEIVRIHEEVGATTIYVTHDQTEAMTMANKIVVMNKGFIQQVGSPLEIYDHPRNIFVAGFIGTPPMNLVEATYDNGNLVFKDGYSIKLDKDSIEKHDKFYQERIVLVDEALKQLAKEDISILEARKILLSLNGYRLKEKSEQKKARKSLIKMIKGLFKKEEKVDLDKIEIEEIIKEIKSIREQYDSCLTSAHSVKFGIRPEHIYFKGQEKGEVSEFLKTKTELVGILGSEFIAYSDTGFGRLIIKSQEPVKPRTDYEISFKLDRIHIFDEISTLNILF